MKKYTSIQVSVTINGSIIRVGGSLGTALWCHLAAGPSLQAVGVELVDMEDMDGTFDAEMVQLAGHFQKQQVILRQRGETRHDGTGRV